jgi:hypothetical protein
MSIKAKRWLTGLLSSTIQGGVTAFLSAGGVATASTMGQIGITVDPLTLNQVGMIFLGGAMKDLFVYLKNNPLIDLTAGDTVIITKKDITQ